MEKVKRTILIVDDDMDFLTQMEIQIKNMGYEVLKAGSQKEGLEMLERSKPDLAIIDLMMENQDSGFILSYRIKQKYPDVPVIIATAVTAETGKVFGLDSEYERQWIKADRYLDKGIRPDQLHRELSQLLND